METTPGEVTRLLTRWSEGDHEAFERLIELTYDELRGIASRHLRRGGRDTILDTTVLVHEAYLKLAKVEGVDWENRARFLAFCSKAMRRLLIDFARRRSAAKRGGPRVRVPLRDDDASVDPAVVDILAVEEAVTRLEEHSPRMARVVELRFYGGMSVADTASALHSSVRTVEREWTRARAYLSHALTEAKEPPA